MTISPHVEKEQGLKTRVGDLENNALLYQRCGGLKTQDDKDKVILLLFSLQF